MKTRGAVLVEEVLLLLVAIALISAFAMTVTGVVQSAVGQILGFRNATNNVLNGLVDAIRRLIGV
ncbi:MAG: hypothetical protein OWQ51_11190 [Pyrobaculum arsenaticum]|uniref:Uncharacterized protein n=2 Tax=Pyrobaculum arsenaticum TaxID=121277 RepID=A4WN28_PYRAR|nr:hypothetical protein [Pyrobaculum arsenaticum]ABP51795.1 conserved hypothetical protein [Pyrobaculum arsenaticum DSM 13514]MCY0891513.1 hypothetical protein [Pyrobaculum arsenaticum]NYR16114.1 hypothetical protein [Pyrobaculum arsenaticum]